jgi:hypothetical protein
MIMKGGGRTIISYLHYVNDLLEIGVSIRKCRAYFKTAVRIQPIWVMFISYARVYYVNMIFVF